MTGKIGKGGAPCCAILAVLLGAAVFCGCGEGGDSKVRTQQDDDGLIPGTVLDVSDKPSEQDNPLGYHVMVRLTYAASISTLEKSYLPEDFPEAPVKTVFEELEDATYAYEQAVQYGREEAFRRRISFTAIVNNREEMFEILRLLNERDDVESASSGQLDVELALDKFEKIDPSILSRVQQDLRDDYIKKGLDADHQRGGFSFYRYYGKHSGYYVMVGTPTPLAVGWNVTIDGISFGFGSPPGFPGCIFGWKDDSSFADIAVLYEQGLLTREDIQNIHDIFAAMYVAEREALGQPPLNF
jgi:hypothetical protein